MSLNGTSSLVKPSDVPKAHAAAYVPDTFAGWLTVRTTPLYYYCKVFLHSGTKALDIHYYPAGAGLEAVKARTEDDC